MKSFRQWLSTNNPILVPLFSTDDRLVVHTRQGGTDGQRRLLCRSSLMEQAIIDLVDKGLQDPRWTGILYLMGWGDLPDFRPLYIGKAGRRGVKHDLSANLRNLVSDKSKFARWGDGLDYHIGDLSQALFGWSAYRGPRGKYEKWASSLFVDRDPPGLRERVNLALLSWRTDSRGPSGEILELEAAENEVIALASVEFKDSLLNVQGETWQTPSASEGVVVHRPTAEKPLRWVTTQLELQTLVEDLKRYEFIGLDVETCIYTNSLRLIQIATEEFVVIVDPMRLQTLSPLGEILSNPTITKIIHNASFERSVFRKEGIELQGVFDTLKASRKVRGQQPEGHKLAVVAHRELGVYMDKSCQVSNWSQRPLSKNQIAYAALDADILISLYKVFRSRLTGKML